ncbi:hypothetical protein ACP275_02G101000 [Erythranthe tilingii]
MEHNTIGTCTFLYHMSLFYSLSNVNFHMGITLFCFTPFIFYFLLAPSSIKHRCSPHYHYHQSASPNLFFFLHFLSDFTVSCLLPFSFSFYSGESRRFNASASHLTNTCCPPLSINPIYITLSFIFSFIHVRIIRRPRRRYC